MRPSPATAPAIALRPDLPWAYVNRGLAHLDIRDYPGALADFDRVIALRPDMVEAYINRAVARMGVGDFSGAVADLDRALEHPDAPVQALFRRATARERLGDRDGAARDRAEGLRRRPNDELSWIFRGLARLKDDPKGALADFDAALAINPRSKSALENKAFVLAERLGRPEEAIRVYDTTLLHHPDDAKAVGPRGVYHARLGRRDAALADARAALALGDQALTAQDQAFTIYQVAGIYALTSAAAARGPPRGPPPPRHRAAEGRLLAAGPPRRSRLRPDPRPARIPRVAPRHGRGRPGHGPGSAGPRQGEEMT